jgi:hypothetical protein
MTEARKVLNELYTGKAKYVVVKLPCLHGSVQVRERKDQFVYCPRCMKRAYLMWEMRTKPKMEWYDNNPKINIK